MQQTEVTTDGLRSFQRRQSPGRVAAPSDAEIVVGLRSGDTRAADWLYARVHQAVARTVRRILRADQREHEDLLQASFEKMIRVLAESNDEVAADLPAWASVVSANVALDALRRRSREQRLFRGLAGCDALPAAEAPPEQITSARSRLARVQAAIGRMRPKLAEAFLLHDVLGYELSEIAELTDVSVAAAQSRLVRGRKDFMQRVSVLERYGSRHGARACASGQAEFCARGVTDVEGPVGSCECGRQTSED